MTEKINKNRISLDVTIRSSENIRIKIIKFVLEQVTKVEGELRYSSTLSLTSALDRMSG
jgi:hypothetical protein